jgi:hypothetical protein
LRVNLHLIAAVRSAVACADVVQAFMFDMTFRVPATLVSHTQVQFDAALSDAWLVVILT